MSRIAVSIFSREAPDQALNVQWNMNDLFPEDSLTSFGVWPERHSVSVMKLKLGPVRMFAICVCVCVCIFVRICRP